jgi:hypothetical protein
MDAHETWADSTRGVHRRPSGGTAITGFSSNAGVALALIRAGIPVFPCREWGPKQKRPYTQHGFHDATTDEFTVRAWWLQWPGALVGIPIGPVSWIWVLDVDGAAGRDSLAKLVLQLGLHDVGDLSPILVKTPSGGLHVYFMLRLSERPRNRAGDIGAGLDTRGVTAEGRPAGYVIAPGSVLPDGRSYDLIVPNSVAVPSYAATLRGAPSAPRELLYLATFSRAQRQHIAANTALQSAIGAAPPSDWQNVYDVHERQRHSLIAPASTADASGLRQQGLHDLETEVQRLAQLNDGRRQAIFNAACRLAKYVAHQVLTAAEVHDALGSAWCACDGAARHGRAFATGAIRRALEFGRNDPLPPLARQFRRNLTAGRGLAR